MEFEKIILSALEKMEAKIDGFHGNIMEMTKLQMKQGVQSESVSERLNSLEKNMTEMNVKMKAMEGAWVKSKDIDLLFERVRAIEEGPRKKTGERVAFVKKAALVGAALFITGLVVSVLNFGWTVVKDLDKILEALTK